MARALVCYVESHLDGFGMKQMSESSGFSEAYLRELFIKIVKMPIMQYYRKRKIIVSAFELLHSDKKIVDIALKKGSCEVLLVNGKREGYSLGQYAVRIPF